MGHLRRLETHHTNVSARRVSGMGRAARLMTPHMVADVRSARNLYIRQCALMLDRAKRAANCSSQVRVVGELVEG